MKIFFEIVWIVVPYSAGLLLQYNSSGHMSIPPAHSTVKGLIFAVLKIVGFRSGEKTFSQKIC